MQKSIYLCNIHPKIKTGQVKCQCRECGHEYVKAVLERY